MDRASRQIWSEAIEWKEFFSIESEAGSASGVGLPDRLSRK